MPRLHNLPPGFSREGLKVSWLLEHRSNPHANYWVYHSVKLNCLIVAETDVVFARSILLEMDPRVRWYGAASLSTPDRVPETNNLEPDLLVRLTDGTEESICCRRDLGTSKKSKQLAIGVHLFTGREVVERHVELDNCMSLLSSMTAALDYTSPAARFAVLERFGPGSQGTLRQILNIPGIDPALLTAAMASLIADGTLVTDLRKRLTLDTVVANVTTATRTFSDRKQPTHTARESAAAGNNYTAVTASDSDVDATSAVRLFSTDNSRRKLIPLEYRYAVWPAPDLPEADVDREKYLNKKGAVDAYRAGAPFAKIKEDFHLSKNEVTRLVHRCVAPSGPGSIHGYFALQDYYRLGQQEHGPIMERRKLQKQDSGKEDKTLGGPWAWTRLLENVAGLEEFITEMVLDHKPTENGKRLDVDDCWARVDVFLRRKGLGESDYPYTNADQGRNALQNYMLTIRDRHADRYIFIYHGKTAGKRAQQLGGTPERIIRSLRPGSFVQLDYYRTDCATTVVRRNPAGELFNQTLPRWYYAMLVDEHYSTVLSRLPTLEINPSTASAIETLDRYVHPELYRVENDPDNDDRLFYEQFEGMTGNRFYVLRVDNAKCNVSDNFIRAAVYTFGCAINYGPTYNWVTRAVCERAIGSVAKRVKDQHDSEPTVNVETLILDLARACNRHNSERTEKLWQSSPLVAFQNALNDVNAGLIAAPLPQATVEDSKYLDHYFTAAVRGKLSGGVNPYVWNLGRRYTNDLLRNRPDLIRPHGSNEHNLVGRVKRWDICEAHGAVDHLPIGRLEPDRDRHTKMSVSDVEFFRKTGRNLKTREALERATLELEKKTRDASLASSAEKRKNGVKSKKPGKASAPVLQEEQQRRRHTYHDSQPSACATNLDVEAPESKEPQKHSNKTIWEGGVDRFGLRVIRGGRSF